MIQIASIVEGKGEESALPILLRRVAEEVSPYSPPRILRPIRVKRKGILKSGELERYVELAARRTAPDGAILILLDADRECPADLASDLLRRAKAARSDRRIRAVLAKMEYEAWFIAATTSIASQYGSEVRPPPDPEAIRDAKGWLGQNVLRGAKYHPTRHQPNFTAAFDLNAARAAPSFDKLWRDVASLLREPRET